MELLASRIGDLLNYSKIASQLEVTVNTVKRYSVLLEKTFILKNLTTYSKNIRSAILKTPKVYFTDLGIRNSLLGLNSISQIEKLNQFGLIFENTLVTKLLTAISLSQKEIRLHYGKFCLFIHKITLAFYISPIFPSNSLSPLSILSSLVPW
jgi:predicted AAA+ superfamily ATPase